MALIMAGSSAHGEQEVGQWKNEGIGPIDGGRRAPGASTWNHRGKFCPVSAAVA
jgi:hypothetical protein